MGTYSWEDESVDIAVVQAVATEANCDPVELESLYDVVDPDALAALFATASESQMKHGRIMFTYSGHEVSVMSDGTIEVTRSGVATEESRSETGSPPHSRSATSSAR